MKKLLLLVTLGAAATVVTGCSNPEALDFEASVTLNERPVQLVFNTDSEGKMAATTFKFGNINLLEENSDKINQDALKLSTLDLDYRTWLGDFETPTSEFVKTKAPSELFLEIMYNTNIKISNEDSKTACVSDEAGTKITCSQENTEVSDTNREDYKIVAEYNTTDSKFDITTAMVGTINLLTDKDHMLPGKGTNPEEANGFEQITALANTLSTSSINLWKQELFSLDILKSRTDQFVKDNTFDEGFACLNYVFYKMGYICQGSTTINADLELNVTIENEKVVLKSNIDGKELVPADKNANGDVTAANDQDILDILDPITKDLQKQYDDKGAADFFTDLKDALSGIKSDILTPGQIIFY